MKKLYILKSFIWLLLLGCNSEKNKHEISTSKVANIKIERFNIPNQNLDRIILSSYIIKQFDSVNNETKSVYYDSNDKIMMQFENSYTNGNKTKITWRNRNDSVVRYVIMSYNPDNKIIKSQSFKPDGELIEGYIHRWKNSYKTEEKGPITDSIFKPNSIYTYTDFNEFESLVEFDLQNDSLYGKFNWKYTKFNTDNEWLVREVYFNQRLTRLEKRTITYRK